MVVFFPLFSDFIILSGTRIAPPYPGEDLMMDYTLGVAWAVVLSLGLCLWPGLRDMRKPLLAIWAAKCVAALGLSLFFDDQNNTEG